MLDRRFQFCLTLVFLLVATSTGFAQQPGGPAGSEPAAQRSYQTPELTPEQQEAQRIAAQQAWAAQQRAEQAIKQPPGFPLSAEEDDFVNRLLDHWEGTSKQLKLYQCDFVRYDYDSSLTGYRDPQSNRLAAHMVSFGEIRFAAPDKAKFETNRLMVFDSPPAQPGEQASYKQADMAVSKERWICDGTRIYEYDFANKAMNEQSIPPDMKENPAESPLPFLFGGEKKSILARYWVRYVPQTNIAPDQEPTEYWLELYPKRIDDARAYSKIELIIAREDFLPSAMHLYDAQYDLAKGQEISRYIAFENRQVNNQLNKFQNFLGVFVPTKLPLGWRRVNMDLPQSQATSPTQNPRR